MKTGAHWLKGYTVDAWTFDGVGWWGPGHSHKLDPETVAARYSYIGPVLTPAEIAAKDARIAELEGALAALQRDASQETSADDLVMRLQANGDVLRHIEAQAAEIARLRATINQIMTPGDNYKRLSAALATARREGMEEAAQKALVIASVLSDPSAQNALRSFADVIRATAKEVKP